MKTIDLTSKTFGRLTALFQTENTRGRTAWHCVCSCGNTVSVTSDNLRSGNTQSCGCLQAERRSLSHTKHGGSALVEYPLWTHMKDRCYNPSCEMFHLYGGRGITVCDDWRASFAAFYRDMGPRPSSSHSLDRIDPDGRYEPSNCRWILKSEQAGNTRRNHRITVDGETMTIAEASRRFDIKAATLQRRLTIGDRTPQEAIIKKDFRALKPARASRAVVL